MKKSTATGFKKGAAIAVALLLASGVATNASARPPASTSTQTTPWTGNGTNLTEGARTLTTETCDAEDTPYLLWILSGSKATSASITINAATENMEKANVDKKGHSTFKFLMSGTVDLDNAVVSATSNDGRNRATLTISHGCLGGESEGLTVVYLGLLNYGTDYAPLSPATTVSLCETAAPTNCVTFAYPSIPGATQTLDLSAPGQLTLGVVGQLSIALLLNEPLSLSDLLAGLNSSDPLPWLIGFAFNDNPMPTMLSFSNSDTVYIVTGQGG